MELKALRPILVDGVGAVVEGATFDTNDQHARQLIGKGYAVEPGEEGAGEPPQQRRRNSSKKE
ncbi:hypothetical protein IPC432_12915 [Pseudomonas aeruginosa]|uniref:hypothetical protein n=1 Tax=Pseudomonas aeruginosa TaxID=287 RepID=UPI000F530DB4|nr:hypothetical protein [Pseudomonas aeruginosa]MBI7501704.1 hypothetical protein [Pseudomonas aeruginosa]MBI8274947.1 hypothetical protein [Pseudomonas aeruginosa]MBL4549702.1 hypothetical protein [Pseudomonas aeruginosa]MCS7645616.1 hypothetical protein [Pseudomonas aeruginosa]MDG3605187.1 hypothetical protein [Pseudomonas aeruginosa]